MKRKFALHPGYITSKNDGDEHYISVGQLAQLYELKPTEYIIWREFHGSYWNDYVHLYPSYEGNYGRPK